MGGRDKGCCFEELADAIAQCVASVAFFGEIRERLHDLVRTRAPAVACHATETLEEALRWCWEESEPGDAVVFSPGCSSADQFHHFQHRGKQFVSLVNELTA